MPKKQPTPSLNPQPQPQPELPSPNLTKEKEKETRGRKPKAEKNKPTFGVIYSLIGIILSKSFNSQKFLFSQDEVKILSEQTATTLEEFAPHVSNKNISLIVLISTFVGTLIPKFTDYYSEKREINEKNEKKEK